MSEYGTPLPPDRKVDYTAHFTSEEMGDIIFKAAMEKTCVPAGTWSGHLRYETTLEPPGIAVVVYLWRSEAEVKPQARELRQS